METEPHRDWMVRGGDEGEVLPVLFLLEARYTISSSRQL